jgi:hypothetical protein
VIRAIGPWISQATTAAARIGRTGLELCARPALVMRRRPRSLSRALRMTGDSELLVAHQRGKAGRVEIGEQRCLRARRITLADTASTEK